MSTTTQTAPDTEAPATPAPRQVGPPSRPEMAVMIWLAVFPTLTAISTVLGPWIGDMSAVVRTFILATIAVPTIVFGEMPWLQRGRVWLLTRRDA